jgi:hypothetical protein
MAGLVAVVGVMAALTPALASASTLINGDFEAGSLEGWDTNSANGSAEWDVYGGRPGSAPPQGEYAATTRGWGPDRTVLYQDVALEPGLGHTLFLAAGYHSTDPIAAPATLKVEESGPEGEPLPGNYEGDQQQFRIDVMKPGAPLDSVTPSDVLVSVFGTRDGDPQSMALRIFQADLSAYAGQTVRIRAVVAVNEGMIWPVLDGVAVTDDLLPPPAMVPAPPPPSNALGLGKAKHNLEKGTETLSVAVPGPGVLTAANAGKRRLVKPVTQTSTAAGTLKVLIAPTAATKKTLKKKHMSKVPVVLAFTPTGGAASTQTLTAVLRMNPRRHRRHRRRRR